MYQLTHNKENGLDFIEIQNPKNKSKATLCLNQGGRLSRLEFDGIKVLANFDPSTYAINYASSILFPFVNRIRDGKYTFDGVDYVLDCNEIDKNNALHGLVYDKTFKYVDHKLTANYGSVTLQYTHNETSQGFPFQFDIQLTYTLSDENFSLAVHVVNTDKNPFPFTIGWHPYFVSQNLDQSAINFDGDTKYVSDKQQIVCGTKALDVKMPYPLEGVKLDNGYPLKNNTICLLTPEYGLKITSSSQENYLQLYTPNTPNIIAIEPMTGAADSFNNKIGLQILQPNANYAIKWDVTFQNHSDQLITN